MSSRPVPVADREAGEVRRAERGRLGDDRSLDRDAEEVGLELEQQVVGRGAAVDAERVAARSPASAAIASRTSATWKAIDSSVARASSARPVPRVMPDDRAARVGIPVRRAEPGERGHEVHAAGVGDATRPAPRRPSARSIAWRPSRSHWTAEPAKNTEPSSAYVAGPPGASCQPTVVSRPCAEARGSAPVFRSRNAPVPYVFFAWPGAKHAWPNVAACWSPASAVIGIGRPKSSGAVSPKTPDVGRTSGQHRRRHADEREQLVVPGEAVDVEEERPAGVRDVGRVDGAARRVPPVSRQSRNVSTVPKASSPRSARERAPGTASRMCAIFGPREVGVERQAGPLAEERLVARERAGARRRAR